MPDQEVCAIWTAGLLANLILAHFIWLIFVLLFNQYLK